MRLFKGVVVSLLIGTCTLVAAQQESDEELGALLLGAQKKAETMASDPVLKQILSASNQANIVSADDRNLINKAKASVDSAQRKVVEQAGDGNDVTGIINSLLSENEKHLPPGNSRRAGRGIEIDTYVLISMSLPEGQLNAFWDQLSNAENAHTVFVLQGWNGRTINDYAKEVFKLTSLQQKKTDRLPSIMIEPRIFMRFGVTEVPLIIAKVGNRWGSVYGMVDLHEARLKIAGTNEQFNKWGATYPVKEQNFYDMVKDRVGKVNWRKLVTDAKNNADQIYDGMTMPKTIKEESYLFDMSIAIQKDIVGAKGEMIAKAGTIVNPFDAMPMRRAVIFFNAMDATQIDVAKNLAQKYPNSVLISTKLSRKKSQRDKLDKEFGRQVFLANSQLIQRFGIRTVPSVAHQEGRYLRVESATTL